MTTPSSTTKPLICRFAMKRQPARLRKSTVGTMASGRDAQGCCLQRTLWLHGEILKAAAAAPYVQLDSDVTLTWRMSSSWAKILAVSCARLCKKMRHVDLKRKRSTGGGRTGVKKREKHKFVVGERTRDTHGNRRIPTKRSPSRRFISSRPTRRRSNHVHTTGGTSRLWDWVQLLFRCKQPRSIPRAPIIFRKYA